MNEIVHFEIPADNVSRAKKFYTGVFGWRIDDWKDPSGKMEYAMVFTRDKAAGVGIDGGMMKRQNPGQVFANYVTVDSIDVMAKKITAAGGAIVMPKAEIAPDMGWIALFKDPEGNVMGLHEPPERMKGKPVAKGFIVRDTFVAKPGQAGKLARLFKKGAPSMPGLRVLTDMVGQYNTVVMEFPVASMADFEKAMDDYRSGKAMAGLDPAVLEEMKHYTDMYSHGKREIFRVEE